MVRLKHRYLLIDILYPQRVSAAPTAGLEGRTDFIEFHAPSPSRFDERALARMVRDHVGELFGDYGAGKIAGSLKIIYLSSATSTAIIRVSRDHVRLVWAALSFVTKLPKPFDTPCVIQVVRNSGTIRLAEEEAIKRARNFVRKARTSDQGSSLDQVLENAVALEEREVGDTSLEDVDMSDDDD